MHRNAPALRAPVSRRGRESGANPLPLTPDSFEAVRAWLDELQVDSSGSFEVVHERPWSTVSRIESAAGDLYLKQCAPVQAFEVPLTAALAERWPDRVPRLVAVDAQRAWLLMRDGGRRLREQTELGPLVRALELYGELQLGEANHVDELLGLGVPDVRVPLVRAAYEPFFERDHGLTSEELDRLCGLAPRFFELCDQLDAFGLPASIQHDDLHDGNVFTAASGVAIFDWGDSSVAHPLWSWLKPLRVANERGLDPEPFLFAYLSAWTAVEPEERLREALRIAIPVGSFAYSLQYQRQLDAMPGEVRCGYERYMSEQLRVLLGRLASSCARPTRAPKING